MGTRGQRNIIVGILTQKLKELVLMCRYQLRKLRVARSELLQDGVQHLGLLLNDLAELLKLRIVAKEVKVTQVAALATESGGSGSSTGSCVAAGAAAGTSSTTSTLLGSEIEKVHVIVAAAITTTRGSSLGFGGSWCGSLGSSSLPLLLLLLDVLGDTLRTGQ